MIQREESNGKMNAERGDFLGGSGWGGGEHMPSGFIESIEVDGVRLNPAGKLEIATRAIQQYLVAIEGMFAPEMKFTILARHPDDPECDLLITKDSLDEVAKAIERCKLREARDGK